jgi:hypothetical protein
MNAPLSRYLTSFAPSAAPPILLEPVAVELEPLPEAELRPEMELEPAFEPEPEPRESEIEVALREARDEAERERASAIAALETAHAAALASALVAARAEWATANAEAAGPMLEAAFAQLREALSDRLAVVLRPVLADAILARTLDVLGQTIDRILADPDHPCLTVRGPLDLVEALRARAVRSEGTIFEAADSVEISVTADGLHVETRLAQALAGLDSLEAPRGAAALQTSEPEA